MKGHPVRYVDVVAALAHEAPSRFIALVKIKYVCARQDLGQLLQLLWLLLLLMLDWLELRR